MSRLNAPDPERRASWWRTLSRIPLLTYRALRRGFSERRLGVLRRTRSPGRLAHLGERAAHLVAVAVQPEVVRHLGDRGLAGARDVIGIGAQQLGDLPILHAAVKRQIEERTAARIEVVKRLNEGLGRHL